MFAFPDPVALSAAGANGPRLFLRDAQGAMLGGLDEAGVGGWAGRRARVRAAPAASGGPSGDACSVDLHGRQVVQRLVRALVVVEPEPASNAGVGLPHVVGRMEVDLFVLE